MLHFEDFEPGATFALSSLIISRDEIISFAREFDPQPFHLDEAAGKASMLGGLAASGWNTCGLVMRLLATNLLNRSTCQGSPGLNSLKWLHPVFPEDTLSAEALVLNIRELRSRPELGLVTIQIEARNQDRTPVLIWENGILFRKREAS